MIYGIKIHVNNAISLLTFKSELALIENEFTQITKEKYNEILEDSTKDPFGTYSGGKWKKESDADKIAREIAKQELKAQKEIEKEQLLDNEFIARYNRLKSEGLLT